MGNYQGSQAGEVFWYQVKKFPLDKRSRPEYLEINGLMIKMMTRAGLTREGTEGLRYSLEREGIVLPG